MNKTFKQELDVADIVLQSTAINFIKKKISFYIFRFLTKKSLPIFLRGTDIISYDPLIDGVYEGVISEFMNQRVAESQSDFLIDIGANIGLTSCQNGEHFKRVVCFEPNPLAANILKTNLAISLQNKTYKVVEAALGDEIAEVELYVPKHNWGGAFVKNSNDYTDEILSAKDGFEEFDVNNYHIEKVKVRSAQEELERVFSGFEAEALISGVVKIDVEGFERKVLLAIAETLPSQFKIAIIFENWDPVFDLDEIKRAFSNRKVAVSKITRTIRREEPLWVRIAKYLFIGQTAYVSRINEGDDLIGDLIFDIT